MILVKDAGTLRSNVSGTNHIWRRRALSNLCANNRAGVSAMDSGNMRRIPRRIRLSLLCLSFDSFESMDPIRRTRPSSSTGTLRITRVWWARRARRMLIVGFLSDCISDPICVCVKESSNMGLTNLDSDNRFGIRTCIFDSICGCTEESSASTRILRGLGAAK